jgi:hypothetical protein
LTFYKKRIPPITPSSPPASAIGVSSGVRLSRVQYAQGKPGSALTEISMDAGISGDYPSIMRFINSLERDPIFFIIRGMSFTGQQGGLVNLRLRVSTWLRPADAAASGLPMAPSASTNPPPPRRARRANNHGPRSWHRKQAPGDHRERARRRPADLRILRLPHFFGSSSPADSGPAPVAPTRKTLPPIPTASPPSGNARRGQRSQAASNARHRSLAAL